MGKRALVGLAGTCMVGLALMGCRPDNNKLKDGGVMPAVPGSRPGQAMNTPRTNGNLGQLPPTNPGGFQQTGGMSPQNNNISRAPYEVPANEDNAFSPGLKSSNSGREFNPPAQPGLQDRGISGAGASRQTDQAAFHAAPPNPQPLQIDDKDAAINIPPPPVPGGTKFSGASLSLPEPKEPLPPAPPPRSLGKPNGPSDSGNASDEVKTVPPPVPSPVESHYESNPLPPPPGTTFKDQAMPPSPVPTMPKSMNNGEQ